MNDGSQPASRYTLAAWAVGATLAYHAVLIAPFAAVLLLNPWAGVLGVWPALAALAFIWWTLQPHHETPGWPLARDDAPALFGELDALAARLGAPRIDEVRLTDDFNAAALEAPVRWQPWRRRRMLLLGVPLLALAGVDAVRGVIAHELGHFSHRHGRLGQWIYRARAGWLSYAQAAEDDEVSVLERAAAAFARWFAPRFARRAFGYSRQCEYEADAFGAAVVGPATMASALLTIEVLDARWQRMVDDELPQLVAAQAAPPDRWLARVQQQVLLQPPQPDEWQRLRSRAADPDDTHPSLGERVQALAISGDEALRASAGLPQPVAGAAWIVNWAGIVARSDDAWRAGHEGAWRREHVRRRHQQDRLHALRLADDLGLERARLELAIGDAAAAEALARRWIDDATIGPEAALVLGCAQLARGDATGIETLEAAIARDAAVAAAARAAIERHEAMLADDAQRTRNRALLERARRRRADARALLQHRVPGGRMAPAVLEPTARSVLQEVLSGWPAVAGAWCAGVDDFVHDERRYRGVVLILRLRPDWLHAADRAEHELIAEAEALLASVLPAPVLKAVWSAYTTEPLTPQLDTMLSDWGDGSAASLVVPRAGEAIGAGVQAGVLG